MDHSLPVLSLTEEHASCLTDILGGRESIKAKINHVFLREEHFGGMSLGFDFYEPKFPKLQANWTEV